MKIDGEPEQGLPRIKETVSNRRVTRELVQKLNVSEMNESWFKNFLMECQQGCRGNIISPIKSGFVIYCPPERRHRALACTSLRLGNLAALDGMAGMLRGALARANAAFFTTDMCLGYVLIVS